MVADWHGVQSSKRRQESVKPGCWVLKWVSSVFRGPLATLARSLFVLVDAVIFPAGNIAHPTPVFFERREDEKSPLYSRTAGP